MNYTIHIHPQPVEQRAAEKIAQMFECLEETSFVRDIAPAILDEFVYKQLDMNLCDMASGEIERALDMAYRAGISMKCVPQFRPNLSGKMELSDLIYRRFRW